MRRYLFLISIIALSSCEKDSEHELEYYIADGKAFLSSLIKNDLERSAGYFVIEDEHTYGQLISDLELTRERIICFDSRNYTINYEEVDVKDNETFTDQRPFYLRYSIECGGRKKFVNVYYHPEHNKIYAIRDFNRTESVSKE